MKSLVAALLFSSTLNAAPVLISKTGTLTADAKNGEIEVSIPADAKRALVEWNPEFVIYNLKDYDSKVIEHLKKVGIKNPPMALIADFDNNGETDIALVGRDLRQDFVVALVQKDKKWTAVQIVASPVAKSERGSEDTKEYQANKVSNDLYVLPALGEPAKSLGKKIGLQIESYMGTAIVYVIENGKASQFK